MRALIDRDVIEAVPDDKTLAMIEGVESGAREVAKPRYAATVMLVRDSHPGQTEYRLPPEKLPSNFPTGQEIEVFMLRRVKTMAFVPDAVVFPGGGVDDRDATPQLPWCGPAPEEWAQWMNVSAEVARKVVVAAAREVFEECGVLLAGPDEQSVVTDLSDPSWAQDRAALTKHELAFADMLIRRGLVLRTDLLGLVSNWLTPEYSPRRYDAFFFAALMPEGQVADDKTSEAQIADWVTPAWAVRGADKGTLSVLPPTIYNLTCIANAMTAESFAHQRKTVQKIMKRPVRSDDGSVVLWANVPEIEEVYA